MALTCRRALAPRFVHYGMLIAAGQGSRNAVVADKDDARPEELAGFCQLGCNILGVTRCRALIGVFEPGPVRKQPVAVNNVKEISHADPIGRVAGGFQ